MSKAKRARDVPHLAKLHAESTGKTLINQALRAADLSRPVDEARLRRVLREELKAR